MTRNGNGKPGFLPGIDVRNGHNTSTLIVALTGMMPGNYGDMRTGDGAGDYVHVTRNLDGSYRLRHVARREGYDGDNVTRAAQFIMNRVV
jgi:hypothetical protein